MRYIVKVDGVEKKINKVRVSKDCINSVWHGRQRPKIRTEEAYFISFDMSKCATVQIEVLDAKIDEVEIRPKAKNIPFTVNGNVITVKVENPCQLSVEVNGYHNALAIFANEPAVKPDKIDRYFGAGEHDAGFILPKSGETIYIDEGAIVHGIMFLKDVKDVKILGRGILCGEKYRRANDYNGEGLTVDKELDALGLTEVIKNSKDSYYGLFNMLHCENITVDGIVLQDSPEWCMTLKNACRNCVINNIKIIGQWKYNSDGIDVCNSYNVSVTNCFIRSFDDCLIVRSPFFEGESGGIEDITFKNNVLWCDWGINFKIWTGHIRTLVKNIKFIDIYNIRLANTAIGLLTRFGSDYSVVDGVRIENVFTETDKEPLLPTYNENDDGEVVQSKSADEDVRLINFFISNIGKPTGNQGVEKSKDYTLYNINYKNFDFINVKQIGLKRYPSIICNNFEKELENVKLQNFTFTNCDL